MDITLFIIFILYPIYLTGRQIYLLYRLWQDKESTKETIFYDIWTLFLAGLFEWLYLSVIKNTQFMSDWWETLINRQTHTPILTQSYETMAIIVLVAMIGLFILLINPTNSVSPMTIVIGIAATYIGSAMNVVWTIHIMRMDVLADLVLILVPIVTIVIVTKAIVIKIREYEPDPNRLNKIYHTPWLNRLRMMLLNSKQWPLLAFIVMLPLMIIVLGILVLFGQAPHSIITAFTQTSDWNLSQQIAPQNLDVDEHYLCTVAAGGHRQIVKPIRKGIRHGHSVTVNRQLMVANAFEQILEERIPTIHRFVRRNYDRYGFPIAKWIRSKWMADVIWIVMKPLEWFFVCVIYSVDQYPEDRIALQYTGKTLRDFDLASSSKAAASNPAKD